MTVGWVWDYPYLDDPPAARNGSAYALTEKPQIVLVKHVLGFAREDWGEGNWTAKDLR